MNTKMIMAIVLTAVICTAGSYMVFGGNGNEKVMVSGSTTVQPLMDAWQLEYEKDHSTALFITGGGSTAGISNVSNGTSDIGMVSKSLTGEQLASGLNQFLIVYDAIAIVVGSAVKVDSLTKDQLKEIFEYGSTVTWADIPGSYNTEGIDIIVREDGSGTRDTFNKIVGITNYKTGNIEFNSAGAVLNYINGSSGANSIGYVNLNSLEEISGGKNVLFPNVRDIEVEGVRSTPDNVRNYFSSAGTDEYELSRELYVITKGAPKGAVFEFIAWMYSDTAQKIAEGAGFVSLTDKARDDALKMLIGITV